MDTKYQKAIIHLKKDPVMKKLIEMYDFPTWIESNDLFVDIIETIINQQLSSKAGMTIFERFKALFPNSTITPEALLKIEDDKIRKAGISYSKISYIKNVANAVVNKSLNLETLHTLSDEEIILELTKIKGIGKWSAEMILMFSLRRVDVFSMGDLGLITAIAKLYGVDKKDIEKIKEISLKWSPYRSIACRYLWRSLENSKKIT